MLDRYKKKGGFNQLLQLLETSPSAKREQFLGLISSESPVWEDALRKRILTINRVYGWDGQYLVEIFSRVQPLTLANALHGTPVADVDKLLSCLPPISKRKITDLMAESNPTPAEKATCIGRMLSEVRGFISQRIITLEKVDPELAVPENIEEILAVTPFSAPISEDVPSSTSSEESKPLSFGVYDNPPTTAPSGAGAQAEVDFLKRKVNQLTSEVNALKHENTVLKDKLAQIKKIA
ncbi:FliG C-terminal domain-containing protein [Bdellovibrio reynosensis]|uniref:Flagellar motor switch protein FliG C-terminal domain-containing protein n=1 Tax=Bdellovibrio reynosensis TaxID=2835041 RepID=A0ABY4CH71_9BACT|nr:FliG C-terminal domain-containing protein [Bdellovibrio reynosensis]UOF02923.1 hypothetical protein MNR06_08145 [Bdellovibrio reynosensis]